MDHIWVISTGAYSDYRVKAVFATKAQAERAAKLTGTDTWGEYQVEEMPFYPKGTDALMVTEYQCSAILRPDGTIAGASAHNQHATLDELREPIVKTCADFDFYNGPPLDRPVVELLTLQPPSLGQYLQVRGADRVAVLKSFNDRLAQHVAVGATT